MEPFATRSNFTGDGMLISSFRKFAGDTQGAALIEGALIFPFLAVLAFGSYEFSNLIYSHHLITTGVRDAARFLARTDDPLAKQTEAKNLATTGTINTGGTRRVSWWAPDNVSITVRALPNPVVDVATGERQYRGLATIQVVEVRSEVTYQGLGTIKIPGIDVFKFTVFHNERAIGE